MSEYRIEVVGLDEMRRRMIGAPDIMEEELRKSLNQAVIAVASGAKPLAPVDTGHLRRSISGRVQGSGVMLVGVVGSTLKDEVYPKVMEFGRKPGPVPPENLVRWVVRKRLATRVNALTVAMRIARVIARKGIKGRKFMQGSLDKNRLRIQGYLQSGVKRIIRRLENGN